MTSVRKLTWQDYLHKAQSEESCACVCDLLLVVCAKDSSWTDHGQPGTSSDVRRAAAHCRSPGNSSDGLFVNNNNNNNSVTIISKAPIIQCTQQHKDVRYGTVRLNIDSRLETVHGRRVATDFHFCCLTC